MFFLGFQRTSYLHGPVNDHLSLQTKMCDFFWQGNRPVETEKYEPHNKTCINGIFIHPQEI